MYKCRYMVPPGINIVRDEWQEAARHFLHQMGFSPQVLRIVSSEEIKGPGKPARSYSLNGMELFRVVKESEEYGAKIFTAEYAPWAGGLAERLKIGEGYVNW